MEAEIGAGWAYVIMLSLLDDRLYQFVLADWYLAMYLSHREDAWMDTRIVYASFDRFPSPKGAATHIDAFTRALGASFPVVELLTVKNMVERAAAPGGEIAASTGRDISQNLAEGVIHVPLLAEGDHLFERVLDFRARIWKWWQQRFGLSQSRAPVAHFRSIFEGYPIARDKHEYCDAIVYEVNGLPSIELKYHYPQVADDEELLQKLRFQEDVCLQQADRIITVSEVNRRHLESRGVEADRIVVIPNGVDTTLFNYREPTLPESDVPLELLYTGTMTAWQGVHHVVDALALYCRDAPARLTLVGPCRPRERKRLEQQIWKAGVSDRVEIKEPVSKEELVREYHRAHVAIAPLTRNDRNTVQGCCPLKVIEAMATGTPLIASRLPVVEELAQDGEHALLVRAGSGKSIKDALFRLRDEPELAKKISRAARQRVVESYQWCFAQQKLIEVYTSLLGSGQ